MICGDVPKTLIQLLAEALYVDENGQVYLNTSTSSVDCDTITPLITCDSPIDYEALLNQAGGQDSCGNTAIKLLTASGQSTQTIRTVTEADNMLMSDEIIILDSLVEFDFYLVAASGSGRERIIKNIGTASITVSAGLGTIDGDTEVILNQWESIHILDYDDNTWLIL